MPSLTLSPSAGIVITVSEEFEGAAATGATGGATGAATGGGVATGGATGAAGAAEPSAITASSAPTATV